MSVSNLISRKAKICPDIGNLNSQPWPEKVFDREAAHEFYERNGFENRAFVFSKKI